nr:acyl-CoA carboxylase subunit epsilon [Streptomyces sp. NBC_00886]
MSADHGRGPAPNDGESAGSSLVIKVVKGRAEPRELAALTTVLLARAGALAQAYPESAPATAGWSRPERVPQHRNPRGRWAPRGRR